MGAVARAVCALALAGLAACGADGPARVACPDLAAELAAARDGDVVRVDACRAEGTFTVPGGVTVEGAGEDGTTLAGAGSGAVVVLGPGAALRRLAVESDAAAGIHAGDPGDPVRVEDVTVRATRGAAVRIEGTGARLVRVTLVGPVTEANATMVPPMPDPADTATHGLFLSAAGAEGSPVTLEDVAVSGFARFGVLAVDSHLQWTGGAASGNLGVGVMARGGTADLSEVELCGTLQGLRPIPAYAGVFDGEVAVSTTALTVCDNEGFGLLHDAARTVHVDLVGSGNSEPALWVQRGGRFELSGDGTILSANRIAGLVAVDVPEVTVRDAQLDDSELARRIIPELGDVETGDGIQIVATSATTSGVRIENVTLPGNQRVGVLLDLEPDATVDDGTLNGVTVDGRGDALGVIAQTPTGPIASGTWDADVTRLGDTVDNDAGFAGRLSVVGIVGPMYLPPVD